MRVFYDSKQIADIGNHTSPSAFKPKLFFDALIGSRYIFVNPPFDPVTMQDLSLVHDRKYVSGVLNLITPNGFGTIDKTVADSLPWTSGALLAACRAALKHGIACAPVSGMHHAHWKGGGAFCTFNGIMLSCVKLLNEKQVKRVLVADFDAHYSDGCIDIQKKLALQSKVHVITGISMDLPKIKKQFLREIKNFKPDLVIAQLAMDPMAGDPLCPGKGLSITELVERDEFIFATAKNEDTPVAWLLGGGYKRDINGNPTPVIQGHLNTFLASLKIYEGANVKYDVSDK